MDSSSDLEETTTNSESINLVMVSIIKDHPVLVEKSQLPTTKERKARALHEAKSRISTNTGKNMTEKQILKKISNMKVHVKKITDGKQTGNRKIIMCPWEQQLYDILQWDANPTITKMACSLSAGFQSHQSGSSSLDVSSCSTYRVCIHSLFVIYHLSFHGS